MQHKNTSGGIAALAAKGRNGDSTLVHMTHEEVAALQRLAKQNGTTLTINPETGLPEAFSLKSFLPMAAGIAGSFFGIPPMVTAGVLGGGTALTSGDLSKGLMAGLGAYGGANLAGGLGIGATEALPPNMLPTEAAALKEMGGVAATQAAPVGLMDTAAANWDKAKTGIESLGTEAGRDAYVANMGGYKGLAKSGLMALSPVLMDGVGGGQQQQQQAPEDKGYLRPYTLDRSPNMSEYSGRGERRYFNDTWTPGTVTALANGGDVPGYAGGGGMFGGVGKLVSQVLGAGGGGMAGATMNAAAGGDGERAPKDTDVQSIAQMLASRGYFANGGGVPAYTPSTNNPYMSSAGQQMQELAHGGIAALASGGTLGSYSDGGQALRGPGDGVSDSIPATINGKQPAKLADGEFVIPARIVSELGNGSTEAGTRQLYAMLERIQKQRGKTVGKGKVAVDSKATQHLPA